jgi:hypothetical protein
VDLISIPLRSRGGTSIQCFANLCFAIRTSKPGYSWVIFPVGVTIFKALADIQGAMDLRSGTLQWKDKSFPVQHMFTVGIHCAEDVIPFKVATVDYAEQIREPLIACKLMIIAMTPAYHNREEYTTKIQFYFDENAIPFLINPQKLTHQFWTGLRNSKAVQSMVYKWPPKCCWCKSESHPTPDCPWQVMMLDNHKPNFHNCHDHGPGWIEPPERPKGMTPARESEIMDMKLKQLKATAGKKTIIKDKDKATENLPPDTSLGQMQGVVNTESSHHRKGKGRDTDNVK